MTTEEFLALSKQQSIPDDLPRLLRALILEAHDRWDDAHRIAQQDGSTDGSWVHAYLHRVEGDLANASYWYRNAGRNMPETSLENEWHTIAATLLSRYEELNH